ncbi:MAG: transporter substrate-binding protein [Clostridia bacterium]|jgi:zinc transport system substrate-binding protein|nr:transporter substrate-binding protein [Clostridia bacterium]
MKKVISIILALLLLPVFTACGKTEVVPEAKDGLTIYTSFYPMYFLASEIAGDKAEVISLVPAGVEPHDWEPKPKTIAELQKADMFVYNGAGMETWVESIIPTLEKSDIRIVEASKGLELLSIDKNNVDEDEKNLNYDPHVWVSPVKFKQQAENIYKELIALDAANKDYYKANYERLSKELGKLDSDFREAVAEFKGKAFIVSHASFGYLAAEYGLTQVAIRGVSPDAEPSPAKLAELVEISRENNIKYIFFESLVSPKLSQTLANEVGAEVLVLNDGQGISEEEIKQGKNYITIMYQNLENLKKALM